MSCVGRGRKAIRQTDPEKRRAKASFPRAGLRSRCPTILSWVDVKLGFRMLVRYPGISVAGGLAIFVGIGLACGFFEFVDDFVRPSLPLDEGRRVVGLVNWDVAANAPERRSLHDFIVWRDELASVESVGAYTTSERNLVTDDGWAEPVTIAEITAAGFGLARVPPLIGRPLIESDEGFGADPVVVIGHGLWEARFSRSPDVVGQRVQLGSAVHTIVGVMPEDFTYPLFHDAWVPLRASTLDYERREGPSILIVGRLASGYTLREAQTELTGLGMRAATTFPETNGQLRPRVLPYAESLGQGTEILILGHAFFVGLLLVVCGTVAALVFARTVARENEVAVRTALGASRLRVVGQVFLEGLVMCAMAAVAALAAVAYAMPRVMEAFWAVQQSRGPFWMDDDLSLRTAVYGSLLAFLAAALTGLIPGLWYTAARARARLRRGSGVLPGGRWTIVIVVQVAIAVAALPTLASEALAAFRAQTGVVPFPAEQYLGGRLEIDPINFWQSPGEPDAVDSSSRSGRLLAELARQLEAEPIVSGVTFASRLPGMDHAIRTVDVEGEPLLPRPDVRTASVASDYFAVLDVPIVAGRGFESGDIGADRNVVVVNRSFVRQLMGGRDPLGRRIGYVESPNSEPERWFEIVGVVADLSVHGMSRRIDAGVYHPASLQAIRPTYVAIHGVLGAESLARRVPVIVASIDPAIRVHDLLSLHEIGLAERASARMLGGVISLAVLSVLILAGMGVYALMSFGVSRRVGEIAIRAALGAQPTHLLAAIFSRAFVQLGLGVLAGATGAVVLGGTTLVGETVLVATVMIAVGAVACVAPARRVLRLAPSEALKAGAE